MGLSQIVDAACTITSDEFVSEGVDNHLRVFAGPGAGKTHWIDTQVKGLIGHGELEPAVQKIACISYTNVAADTLRQRLGDAVSACQVSTAHSFLYLNVVKPYAHLVCGDDGEPLIDTSRLDRHDEPRCGYKLTEAWLKRISSRSARWSKVEQDKVYDYLENLYWTVEAAQPKITPRRKGQPAKYFPTKSLFDYKLTVWEFGRLEHEDVLYFSWRVLAENEGIRALLAARYPYIIVDEFQDTSPIQSDILRWLAEAGSRITVVGDVAQAIYYFHGARPEHFFDFKLSDVVSLKIDGNRRSTKKIVTFLNGLRLDGLTQKAIRQDEGVPVTVVVGDIAETLSLADTLVPQGETLYCLSRNNKDVSILRQRGKSASQTDPWSQLKEADSDRYLFFKRLCSAAEFQRVGNYVQGCRELLRVFRPRANGEHRKPLKANVVLNEEDQRAAALEVLLTLAGLRGSTCSGADAYHHVGDRLTTLWPDIDVARLTRGRCSDLLKNVPFITLLHTLKMLDDRRAGQTIHKAKGAEFDNVFVSLQFVSGKGVKSRLSHILQPQDDEEHRITYVGLSRARERLLIQVPHLSSKESMELESRGIAIHFAGNRSITSHASILVE